MFEKDTVLSFLAFACTGDFDIPDVTYLNEDDDELEEVTNQVRSDAIAPVEGSAATLTAGTKEIKEENPSPMTPIKRVKFNLKDDEPSPLSFKPFEDYGGLQPPEPINRTAWYDWEEKHDRMIDTIMARHSELDEKEAANQISLLEPLLATVKLYIFAAKYNMTDLRYMCIRIIVGILLKQPKPSVAQASDVCVLARHIYSNTATNDDLRSLIAQYCLNNLTSLNASILFKAIYNTGGGIHDFAANIIERTVDKYEDFEYEASATKKQNRKLKKDLERSDELYERTKRKLDDREKGINPVALVNAGGALRAINMSDINGDQTASGESPEDRAKKAKTS